jgi:hypothetical protein
MSTITTYPLPLISQPQILSVMLLGITYNLRTRWSVGSNCWVIDIADQDNNSLATSIPLITGADILEQYRYLNIDGGLYVQESSGPPDVVPGFTQLGGTGQLLFIPYSTVDALVSTAVETGLGQTNSNNGGASGIGSGSNQNLNSLLNYLLFGVT